MKVMSRQPCSLYGNVAYANTVSHCSVSKFHSKNMATSRSTGSFLGLVVMINEQLSRINK
jgi:hypothetical protein